MSKYDENICIALENMYNTELKEIEGAIKNEHIWELGYDGEEPNPHTQNIENLNKLKDIIKEMLDELNDDSDSSKDSSVAFSIEVSEDDRCEFVGQIIDIFEDFLEEKGVDIANDEKDGREDPESCAILYGSDYGELQASIEDLMTSWDKHTV